MSVRKGASAAAVLSGLLWVAAAVLGWDGDAQGTLFTAGLVLFVLALAALGYSLVATAPVWLRAVVTVATPALGYMVWITVRDAFGTDHLPVLGFGALLLVAGVIGLSRSRDEASPKVAGGHRARR